MEPDIFGKNIPASNLSSVFGVQLSSRADRVRTIKKGNNITKSERQHGEPFGNIGSKKTLPEGIDRIQSQKFQIMALVLPYFE